MELQGCRFHAVKIVVGAVSVAVIKHQHILAKDNESVQMLHAVMQGELVIATIFRLQGIMDSILNVPVRKHIQGTIAGKLHDKILLLCKSSLCDPGTFYIKPLPLPG